MTDTNNERTPRHMASDIKFTFGPLDLTVTVEGGDLVVRPYPGVVLAYIVCDGTSYRVTMKDGRPVLVYDGPIGERRNR